MVETTQSLAPVRVSGWRRMLALAPELVDFDRRGFRTGAPETRRSLETSAAAFLAGFNLMLRTPAGRAPDLSGQPPTWQGFSAEGAAMAAALLDGLNPGRGRRFAALLDAYQSSHVHLIQVGVGWADAKLHRAGPSRYVVDEPLLRWLSYDGRGFCRAFFASEQGMRRWARHPARCEATCDILYQGVGRSLWFRECGDPDAIGARILQLPLRHHGDLWSGVGLAAAYAGGVPAEVYQRLRERGGEHAPALAQGAAFGAEAWRRCGYAPAHAHTAVTTLAGTDLDEAATWTDQAQYGLNRPGAGPADYRTWRRRIQQRAATSVELLDH